MTTDPCILRILTAAEVIVPPHMPDNSFTRNDILDYYVEVERFDSNVEQALNLLEESGQLDNTIVVVTSDHEIHFPRAKASLSDYSCRVPLAVSWPSAIPSGGTVNDFVSLSDLAPHSWKPPTWPLCSPNTADCARGVPYGEIDSSPTKTFMMENRDDPTVDRLAELAFGTRPGHELYDLRKNPGQLRKVATEPALADKAKELDGQLMAHLAETGDPRALGKPVPWDFHPYYGRKVNQDWTVDAPQ